MMHHRLGVIVLLCVDRNPLIDVVYDIELQPRDPLLETIENAVNAGNQVVNAGIYLGTHIPFLCPLILLTDGQSKYSLYVSRNFVVPIHLELIIYTVRHLPTWFPGAGFKRQTVQYKPAVDGLFETPYTKFKAAMVRRFV